MIKSFGFQLSPLLISLVIYVFYRSELTVVNQLIGFFIPIVELLKWQDEIQTALPLPSWAIYSLPEGLWVLFVTLISKEFHFSRQSKNYSLVVFPLLMAVAIEIVQYANITNGTFDWLDLGFAFTFWSIACFLIPPKFNVLQLNKPFKLRRLILFFSYAIVILSDVF